MKQSIYNNNYNRQDQLLALLFWELIQCFMDIQRIIQIRYIHILVQVQGEIQPIIKFKTIYGINYQNKYIMNTNIKNML